MATYCAICGKKFGLLDGKVSIADGMVCIPCWTSAGFDMGFKAMLHAHNKTTQQLKDLIEIEVLKTGATKAGLRNEVDSACQEAVSSRSGSKAHHKTSHASSEIEPVDQAEPAKPVDIILKVDQNNGIIFACEGHPVINFEDLINGNEMVIGDGYISNDNINDLPEIRIGCEFEPAIIDPGLIYYEAGTFKAGIEGQFEIDDPPVNLEEYAKVKRLRRGKIRFTLFVGEQEIISQECPMTVKAPPAQDIQKLMDAVVYEDEKNASGPVNVFLYARERDSYTIDLMRKPELLYSMYSNGQEQLIGDVFVSNSTGHTLKGVQFDANFSSDILAPVSIYLGDVRDGENLAFEVDDPAIDVAKLEMLTEIETCIATYRISIDGKTVAEVTDKITICPFDQWNAALILLPAYMTPNHPNVISVLKNASQWMLINGMNPSLEGYQSDAERVEEMVRAVFNSLKEANIIYSNPPASFFGPQRIRLAETIFDQRFATCLDITILFAACLESFGLHPILITAPSHIFAGVWLTEKGVLKEPIVSDAKLIQSYIKKGQLVALECTAMTAAADMTYEKAKKTANEILDQIVKKKIADHECIDVQIARAMGIRPLPIRVSKATKDNKKEKPEKPLKTDTVANKNASAGQSIEPRKELGSDPLTFKTEEYREFDGDLSYITIDNFYDKQNKKALKEAIASIVEIEGPISQPALVRVLVSSTSLGRAGGRINEYLDKLVAAADVKITRQNGIRFLWKRGVDPKAYSIYRIKELRSPEDISKYELKNAVCYLLQEKGPMNRGELTKALVGLFGYKRSNKKVEDGAQAAIKAAREFKAVTESSDKRLTLAN